MVVFTIFLLAFFFSPSQGILTSSTIKDRIGKKLKFTKKNSNQTDKS